jgi:hypothetical protein
MEQWSPFGLERHLFQYFNAIALLLTKGSSHKCGADSDQAEVNKASQYH